MYYVDGQTLPLEMLSADQAAAALAGLTARCCRTTDTIAKADLATAINEVTAWLDQLAAEHAAEAAEDAAAEHATDLFADALAGL